MLRALNTTLIAMFAAALVFVALRPAAAKSRWGANYFPNVLLTTQDGKQVKFYDDLIKGKIVAIDLIYTQCKDACPLETARMRQVQKLLGDRVGKDIFFYSISIDPKNDTPEVLKDYAEMYNAGPGWTFLTGKEEDIVLLSQKLGLYSPDWGRDGHRPALLIGNEPAGQWMRNSATDNPHFLATMLGDFIDNWRNHTPAVPTQSTAASGTSLNVGEYLFASHCAACHTIGNGEKVGPDLAHAISSRDRAWLMRYIAAPDKLLEQRDPQAIALSRKYGKKTMPNLHLANDDISAIVDYLAKTAVLDKSKATQ